MKKILTTLLAVMCVFSVMGTAVAADTPDYGRGNATSAYATGVDSTGKTEVFFNKAEVFEWTIPAKTELAKATPEASDYTGSGNVEVIKAMIGFEKELKITIDDGENYRDSKDDAEYGSKAGFNMGLRDSADEDYIDDYFVAYKIEVAESGSNPGDATYPATLKTGAVDKENVLIQVPAGQAIKDDAGELNAHVILPLVFTKTGNAAMVGKYSDLLTFTASVVDPE